MIEARAGDVLLFHRPTNLTTLRRDPLGTLMTAAIHVTTNSRWNHAALAVGDGLMVEATSKGVVLSRIADSTDEITVVPMDYSDGDRDQVLAWATGRVGWRYGYLRAFLTGLRNLLPGIPAVKFAGHVICSELVAEALERAGYEWATDTSHVSPGDLAEALGVPRR